MQSSQLKIFNEKVTLITFSKVCGDGNSTCNMDYNVILECFVFCILVCKRLFKISFEMATSRKMLEAFKARHVLEQAGEGIHLDFVK